MSTEPTAPETRHGYTVGCVPGLVWVVQEATAEAPEREWWLDGEGAREQAERLDCWCATPLDHWLAQRLRSCAAAVDAEAAEQAAEGAS